MADLTPSRTLVVMEGDQTGQELLEEALRVLDPDVTGLPLELERHDLSLENRRSTRNRPSSRPRRPSCPRLRPEGRHHHPGGRRGRRQPERPPARGHRRQGHHPQRPPALRRAADRGHPRADLDRADGGRRRLQRPRVPRGRRRRRGRLARRAHLAPHLPGGRRVRLPQARRMHATVFGGPSGPSRRSTRGAEGGARRGRRPPPRCALPADADRRPLRGADQPHRRRPGRPGAQPRRRLPLGHGAAALRLDRRGGVAGARLRRRVPGVGGDGRGPPRDGADAPGQERRQPAGDDPRRVGAALHAGRARLGGLEGDLRGALEAIAEEVRTADLGGHGHRRVHRRGHQAGPHEARRLGGARGRARCGSPDARVRRRRRRRSGPRR